ncbi:CBS domain-containing protein [Oceanisphaera pacifica]|uniref:CBS domain-containing protein n=1 Tax=Oceanisphaera pacifica TaxID=2818389 RepID=A0ABS3NF87_9GAMM|nr:CBS domain-containing protein [Oceanisphaera pacifica]MBO1519244.1 CBS domain-containing protein [Oceanisphaera pacifica]
MRVQEIMTRRIATVHQDDRLAQVQDIFTQSAFRHLLVLNSQEVLCGIISHADMTRALSPYLGTDAEVERDRDTLQRRVHQVMSRDVITITGAATLESAARIMLEHNIGCLPVMEQDKLVGLVSWKDLLRQFIAKT